MALPRPKNLKPRKLSPTNFLHAEAQADGDLASAGRLISMSVAWVAPLHDRPLIVRASSPRHCWDKEFHDPAGPESNPLHHQEKGKASRGAPFNARPEKDHRQEPARSNAHDRDIVGVDRDSVTAHIATRQGDWVGCSDERALWHIDRAGVFAYCRAESDFFR